MSSRRYLLPIVALVFLVVVCIGVVMVTSYSSQSNPQNIDAPAEMQELSLEFATDVQIHTAHIKAVLQNLSCELSGLTPDDPRATAIIRSFYDQYPDATGIAWVDANGSVCREPVYSLPSILHSPEITAINESSFAEHDVLMIGPLSSRTYGMVLCFVVPVYAQDGTYNGFVCLSHMAVLLLNETPGTPYFKDTFYGLWVINSDGTYLYHPDSGLIGQNIYTNPLFLNAPSVLTGVKAVASSSSGAMKYAGYELSFTEVVEKTGVWTTISFGGQDIRLVLDDYSYEPPAEVPLETISPKKLKSIAESMRVYASAHGKEKTIAAINNPSGPFTVSGYSLFAFDTNGTLLAQPSDLYGVGMDRTNYRDAYGMLTVNSMITRCQQGGGHVHYYVKYPYVDQHALLRLAYVLPVGDGWFVGVDGPILDHLVPYTMNSRMDVVHAVQGAEEYVMNFGKEVALSKMMDPTDPLAMKEPHLFALEYNGTLLADEMNTSAVGSDVFYYTDSYGNSPIREAIILARDGGGYFYIETEDPVTGQYVLSLGYIEPVDDTWCIAGVIELDAYELPADSPEVRRGSK